MYIYINIYINIYKYIYIYIYLNDASEPCKKKLNHNIIKFLFFFSDNAYLCDPRIARFKSDEKEKKLAEKKAKQDAIRQKVEEEERVSGSCLISRYTTWRYIPYI